MIKLIRTMWRRFRRFCKRYGLGIAVTLLVGISVFLSLLLWYSVSNPGEMDHRQEQQEGAKEIVANKPIQAVYDTDRLIINKDGDQDYIVNYRSLANGITQKAYNWDLEPVKTENYTKAGYLKQLQLNNHILLGYPDDVAGEIVSKDFKSDLKLPKNAPINQIVIPINGHGAILFADDKNHKVYRAKLKQPVQPLKFKHPKNVVKEKLIWRNNKIQLFAKSKIHLEKRSYLLENTKLSDISQNVFDDVSVSPKATTENSKTTYRAGNRQLTLNNETGGLTLSAYLNQKAPTNLEKKEVLGYRWLTARTTIPENMYYFEMGASKKEMDYRFYSDGLPIFNHDVASLVRVKFNDERQVEVRFSRYAIQVPLPKRENRMVTLPDETTATKQVLRYGIRESQIQDLRIGYEWVGQGNQDFVNLVPRWFLKVDNRWLPVDNRLKNYKAGDLE